MKISLFILFLVLALANKPCQDNWKKEIDKDGIIAFTRRVEGKPFKEFRGEVIIESSIPSLIKVISDVENSRCWQYRTKTARFINRDGNKIFYYYEAQTPSFLKTRVSYQKLELVSDTVSGEVTLFLENIPPIEPIPNDCLEIPLTKGFWRLTPLENGKTKVELQMYFDPGGMIPAWLANLVVFETPYFTLSGLRKKLEEP